MLTTRADYVALRLRFPAISDANAGRTLGVSRERIRQLRGRLGLPSSPRPARKVNRCPKCRKQINPGAKACREHPTNGKASQGSIMLTCEQCKVKFPRRLARHLWNLRRGYKHVFCGRVCLGQSINGNKTHCKRGHEFPPGNTEITKQGYRRCRACNRLRSRQ